MKLIRILFLPLFASSFLGASTLFTVVSLGPTGFSVNGTDYVGSGTSYTDSAFVGGYDFDFTAQWYIDGGPVSDGARLPLGVNDDLELRVSDGFILCAQAHGCTGGTVGLVGDLSIQVREPAGLISQFAGVSGTGITGPGTLIADGDSVTVPAGTFNVYEQLGSIFPVGCLNCSTVTLSFNVSAVFDLPSMLANQSVNLPDSLWYSVGNISPEANTPEPGTLLILAGGLAAVFWFRRRLSD